MKNRLDSRQVIDLVATLHTPHSSHDILITDISLGGVRLQLRNGSVPLPFENEVVLDVPLFREIRAQIVWNENNIHGIKFLECPPSFVRFMDTVLGYSHVNETRTLSA